MNITIVSIVSIHVEQKINSNQMKMCVKIHDYCYIEMIEKDNILKHNHGEKSMKVSFVIYADTESLLEKIDKCHKNPQKSSTTKSSKHKT